MKRNTIIFIINWWAKQSSPAFLLISLTVLISCRKQGDFDIGAKPQDSNIGIQFTDTLTLNNSTLLLNDSIVSARADYLSYGGYNDPGYFGKTYCEAYFSLGLVYTNPDYSGVVVDSANLYMLYANAYGDTLSNQDLEVHQITTQLDGSVPYQTTSSFVTYSPVVIGEKTSFQARPYSENTLKIPLNNAFATRLLSVANNNSNADFQNLFYGMVIKPKNNSIASVIRSYYTSTHTGTRLTVYFKRGQVRDSTIFSIQRSPSSFNRVITDRNGTNLSSLVSNGNKIDEATTNHRCYLQSGTGIVTKVEIPNLKNLVTANGANSIIVNKAILVIPVDEKTEIGKYSPEDVLRLLQMNSNNTYKYAPNGQLAYVQASGFSQLGTNSPAWGFSTTAEAADTVYRIEVTSYIQSLVANQLQNDGFIIMPVYNSYLSDRTVIYSSKATERKMRLELYYTKVK